MRGKQNQLKVLLLVEPGKRKWTMRFHAVLVLFIVGMVLLLLGCDLENDDSSPLGSYTVNCYLEDIGSSSYTLYESEEYRAEIGSTISVEPKTYSGFTEDKDHEDRVAGGMVKADGSLALHIFYNRNSYPLNFMANGGVGAMESMALETGQKILLPDNGYTMDGHRFIGWSLTESGNIAYGDGCEFTMGVSETTLFANWLQNRIIEGLVGSYAPISGASVEFFAPDGEHLGGAVTASDGFYRWEAGVNCDSYEVTVSGGSLLGSNFNGVLRGTTQSDECNLTPFSTLEYELADRLDTTCGEAGQQLSAWLEIPEDEDPFVNILLGEDVVYAEVDALTHAIRSIDGGVSGWINKVISAFESESEPNAMWVEPLQTDAQTIWSKALNRDRGDTVKINLEITVTRPSFATRRYQAVYHRRGVDRSNQDVYVWFVSPVEVRNSGYLCNMVNGEDQTHKYLSSDERVFQIVSTDYTKPFMDNLILQEDAELFTYEDVQFPFVGTYTPKYALETKYLGLDAYVIRLEKDDGDTAYDAMDVVILKDSSLIVDRKMYAKESPLVMVKHVYSTGLELVEGFLTPTTIMMDNPDSNSSIGIQVDHLDYDVVFEDGTFTTRNLEK
jgi:hypothetical protein